VITHIVMLGIAIEWHYDEEQLIWVGKITNHCRQICPGEI